jgi:hypothetical protein
MPKLDTEARYRSSIPKLDTEAGSSLDERACERRREGEGRAVLDLARDADCA